MIRESFKHEIKVLNGTSHFKMPILVAFFLCGLLQGTVISVLMMILCVIMSDLLLLLGSVYISVAGNWLMVSGRDI